MPKKILSASTSKSENWKQLHHRIRQMDYEFKGEQLHLVEATELLKQRTIKKRLDLLGRIRLNLRRQNKLVKMVDEQASSMMNHSAEADSVVIDSNNKKT